MGIEVFLALLGTSSHTVAATLLTSLFDKSDIKQRQVLSADIKTTKGILEVRQFLENEQRQIGKSATESLVVGAIDMTHYRLAEICSERIRQARSTFNAAVALIIAGILVILAGVSLLYLDKTTAGLASAAVGTVMEIIGVLLFRFNAATADRLDKLMPDLDTLEFARAGMEYIKKIKDRTARDDATQELIKELTVNQRSPRAESAAPRDSGTK